MTCQKTRLPPAMQLADLKPSLFHITARNRRDEPTIHVPSLGLTARVRLRADAQRPMVVDMTYAHGFGPPVHRREESVIFEIMTGRYLFQVEGQRFIARRGDLVSVPGGAVRGFVNVTGTAARQQIFVYPGFDVEAYFRELDQVLSREESTSDDLRELGLRWRVQFVGEPLSPIDSDLLGDEAVDSHALR